MRLSICLSPCLAVSLSVSLSLHGRLDHWSVSGSVCLSICLSFCLWICLSLSLPLSLGLSVYLSICLSVYLIYILSNMIQSNPIQSNLIYRMCCIHIGSVCVCAKSYVSLCIYLDYTEVRSKRKHPMRLQGVACNRTGSAELAQYTTASLNKTSLQCKN